MWAIMRAFLLEKCIQIDGEDVVASPDCPKWFIPIFETREQALKFTGGDDTHLVEMEERK